MDQIYKTDLNELFSYQRKGEKLEEKEKVIEIEIERLRDFKEHPFHVKDDKEMSLLKESIKNYGILSPLIVRPVLDGVYEIVSGHRRKYAAQQLGYYKLPVIIRVMNDDEAIISMVDSNLQRERIRYSEKAFLYIQCVCACAASMFFMGILCFTATNLLRNIGIGIGCVFLLWLFLTSSITRILPQLLQLFKLSGEVVQDGFLTPYWPSRILYAVVAIGLLFLNLYLVNKQPDYNKKGWCKHGNKGK